MADDSDPNNSKGFRKEGNAVYADPGSLPQDGSGDEFGGWSWTQIEAAIVGSAATTGTDSESRAVAVSNPQTLFDAANNFYTAQRNLEIVAKSIKDQAVALAGDNGPWQGTAAKQFLKSMTKLSDEIQGRADQMSGGSAKYNGVVNQLYNNGQMLQWAKKSIVEIDHYYAKIVAASGITLPNGQAHIEAVPEAKSAMTAAMKEVADELVANYHLTTNDLTIPDSTGIDGGAPPPDAPAPPPPPPPLYVPGPPPPDTPGPPPPYSPPGGGVGGGPGADGSGAAGAVPPPPKIDVPPPGAGGGDGAGAPAPQVLKTDVPPPPSLLPPPGSGGGSGAGGPDGAAAPPPQVPKIDVPPPPTLSPPPGAGGGAGGPDGAAAPPPQVPKIDVPPPPVLSPPPGLGGLGDPKGQDKGVGAPPPLRGFGGGQGGSGAGGGSSPGEGAGSGRVHVPKLDVGKGPGGVGPGGLGGADGSAAADGGNLGRLKPAELPGPPGSVQQGGPHPLAPGQNAPGAQRGMSPPMMPHGGGAGAGKQGASERPDAAGLINPESEPWKGTELSPTLDGPAASGDTPAGGGTLAGLPDAPGAADVGGGPGTSASSAPDSGAGGDERLSALTRSDGANTPRSPGDGAPAVSGGPWVAPHSGVRPPTGNESGGPPVAVGNPGDGAPAVSGAPWATPHPGVVPQTANEPAGPPMAANSAAGAEQQVVSGPAAQHHPEPPSAQPSSLTVVRPSQGKEDVSAWDRGAAAFLPGGSGPAPGHVAPAAGPGAATSTWNHQAPAFLPGGAGHPRGHDTPASGGGAEPPDPDPDPPRAVYQRIVHSGAPKVDEEFIMCGFDPDSVKPEGTGPDSGPGQASDASAIDQPEQPEERSVADLVSREATAWSGTTAKPMGVLE